MSAITGNTSITLADLRTALKDVFEQKDSGSGKFSSPLPLDKTRLGQMDGIKKIYATQEAQSLTKHDKAKAKRDKYSATMSAMRQLDQLTKDLRLSAKSVGIFTDLNAGKSVFEERAAQVTIPSGKSCVSVDVENSAALQNHTISVNRLAYAGSRNISSATGVGFSGTTTDITNGGAGGAGFFAPGVFKIQSLSSAGASADITIVNGDTLGTICDKINSVSVTTKVSATMWNLGPKGYTLKCVSTDTGLVNDFTITDNAGGGGAALAGVYAEGVGGNGFATVRHIEVAAAGASGFVDKVSDITTGGGGQILSGGTFVLNGTSITVGASASLNNMMDLINNYTTTTGVVASITANTGGGYNLALDLSGNIASKIVLTDNAGVFAAATSNSTSASNSLSIVDGDEVESSSNSILPLSGQSYVDANGITRYSAPKITFNLEAVNNFGDVQNVSIIPDEKEILGEVDKLMDRWSALSRFIAKQTEREVGSDGRATGAYKSTALLGKVGTGVISMSSIRRILDDIMNKVYGTTQAGFNSIADVGMVLTKLPSNPETDDPSYTSLAVDPKKFLSALRANLEGVKAIFVPTFNANGQNIIYGGISAYKTKFSNFDLSFNVVGGSATAGVVTDSLSGVSTAVTVKYDTSLDSVVITGDAGTDADGLVLSCGNIGGAGAGVKNYTNLSLSHGVIDNMNAAFSDYVSNGPLEQNSIYSLAEGGIQRILGVKGEHVTKLQKRYDHMLARHTKRLNVLARKLIEVQNQEKQLKSSGLAG